MGNNVPPQIIAFIVIIIIIIIIIKTRTGIHSVQSSHRRINLLLAHRATMSCRASRRMYDMMCFFLLSINIMERQRCVSPCAQRNNILYIRLWIICSVCLE